MGTANERISFFFYTIQIVDAVYVQCDWLYADLVICFKTHSQIMT